MTNTPIKPAWQSWANYAYGLGFNRQPLPEIEIAHDLQPGAQKHLEGEWLQGKSQPRYDF